MNTIQLLKVLNLSFIMLISLNVQAEGRCPANESGCKWQNLGPDVQQKVNEGANKVIQAETLKERTKEMGSTMKECTECLIDGLKDAVDFSSEK